MRKATQSGYGEKGNRMANNTDDIITVSDGLGGAQCAGAFTRR